MVYAWVRTGTFAALLLSVTSSFAAQAAAPPPYQQSRQDEDNSYLGREVRSDDFWDPIKFIPLGDSGSYLSFGGEARERYEYFHNNNWGLGPQDDNGYLLQRYMLHADWRINPALRIFLQLKSGLETGRDGGPRPTDEDHLDLHQGFLEYRISFPAFEGSVIAGRQEMTFGSSRLVALRDSPNVRQSFDGLRFASKWQNWRINLFKVRPVFTNIGSFDDDIDHGRSLSGIYTTRMASEPKRPNADFYYFYYSKDDAHFDQGTANEKRHSVGTRIFGRYENFDFNEEVVYQWGDFGSASIEAWTVASDAGYTVKSLPGAPRFSLRADITSGDKNPSDNKLGTFNAMFPRGNYFGDIAQIGPYNEIDLHPIAEWHLSQDVKLTTEWDFFWRQSLHDGVYGPSGNLLRSGNSSRERYIGSQPSVQLDWEVSRHIAVGVNCAYFHAGSFLNQASPSSDIQFGETWITYRF